MSAMDSEQFFLKWNNFESNLASGFADLLRREAMVDVTLAAEGKIVQAHKIILSICSSYFRNMFQVNPCQHPIVVLKDVGYQELTDMLDFMYKGEANVRQEDLPSFLKLAETLEVKGLAGNQGELDENYRKKNTESQKCNQNISSSSSSSSSFVRDSFPDYSDKDSSSARKKSKRCSSPFLYPESKNIAHSPNIKLEMEECDSNFVRNSMSDGGPMPVIKEERLSENSVDSFVENVMHDCVEVEKNAGPSTVDENSDSVPQETKDYGFLESGYGGLILVMNGFRYRKKSKTPEKSYWFCCRAKCPAKGILKDDGSFVITHSAHTHEPDTENLKRREKLVQLKKLAVGGNRSGKELLEMLDMKTDYKKNLNFIRTCRSRSKRKERMLFSGQSSVFVGSNYKCFPSRVPSKEMLFHSGFLFRQDSVNPQNKKCKYWRCRVKSCKARAKTDEAGNLTLLKPEHNHEAEKSEEVFRKLKETTESKSKTEKRKGKKKKSENGRETCLSSVKEGSLSFGSSAPNSPETFSLEKLMAETLAENYCVSPGFNESFTLLKNE